MDTNYKLEYHYPTECIRELLRNPWKILLSPFVRPEDVFRYEKIGIKYFKIAGRNTEIQWILQAVNVYYNRNFNDNIIDLLNRTYSLSRFKNKLPTIYIPNNELDGLIDIVDSCKTYNELCQSCKKLYYKIIEGTIYDDKNKSRYS